MPKQPRLIDAGKVVEFIRRHGYMRFAEIIHDAAESGTFDPTPPVQPDIKPGDKVRHGIYGAGAVDKVGNRKYVMVQFPGAYIGCNAEELEVIIDE